MDMAELLYNILLNTNFLTFSLHEANMPVVL